MGSPAFAVPSLRALAEAGYDLRAAVTQPDRPAGRGGRVVAPEVKQAAVALGVPVFQPETYRAPAAVEHLREFAPDVMVVAAYGKILSQRVLDIPARGCVNVHASLLPRWRGASPIAAAILAGDPETGVSIMEMVREMDAGPVIATVRTPIGAEETTGMLEERLATMGAEALVRALPAWIAGTLPAALQDEALVTTCRTIEKADGHLRPTMTAAEAARAVRAYDPWPGAYVLYRGERLAIWRAHVAPADGGKEPGTLFLEGRGLAIAFQDGALVLDEVQRPGGKRMAAEAFVNGERGNLAAEVGLA